MMIDEKGFLRSTSEADPKIVHMPLPAFVTDESTGKRYNKFKKGPSRWLKKNNGGVWLGMVIHYTAGAGAARSARYMQRSKSSVGTHIICGRDGAIYQLAPFGSVRGQKDGRPVSDPNNPIVRTFHAGLRRSDRPVYVDGPLGNIRFKYPNNLCIGIDLASYGPLKKRGDKFYWWARGYTAPFDGPVYQDQYNQYWEAVPEAQFNSMVKLGQLLMQRFGIYPEYIVGHRDVTPARKQDPGNAWFHDEFIEAVYAPKVKHHRPEHVLPPEEQVKTISEEAPLPVELEFTDEEAMEIEVNEELDRRYADRAGEPPVIVRIVSALLTLIARWFR